MLDEIVHLAGGSGALAQRIWFTLLIAAILVAGVALARSLSMSPLAGIAVGVVFFMNPMTLSQVGINDVYLVAMVLVAALPAALIAYARGTLKLWQLSVAFAQSCFRCHRNSIIAITDGSPISMVETAIGQYR